MNVEETEVYFFRQSKTERGAIVHKLAELHITTIDTADKKVLCKRHFGLTLSTAKGHRRLYFFTYAKMIDGLDYLLRAQGFSNRIG